MTVMMFFGGATMDARQAMAVKRWTNRAIYRGGDMVMLAVNFCHR
jgi:hypothetical protein